jgi:TPR repeat protein
MEDYMDNSVKIKLFAFLAATFIASGLQAMGQLTKEEVQNRYIAACKFLTSNTDIPVAEKLLLSIVDQVPALAYKGLFGVAHREYAANPTPMAIQKKIEYALIIINKYGMLEACNDLGRSYEQSGDYSNAKTYFKKAIEHKPEMIQYKLDLARVIARSYSENKELMLAVQYYREAAKQNEPAGIYGLALAYAIGKGTEKNPKSALSLYERIIANPESVYYAHACNDMGLLYEWGALEKKSNILKAYEYFKKSKDAGCVRGKAHIARLILTEKVSYNSEQEKEAAMKQAAEDLKECVAQGDDLALYLYSALLISQGDIERGIQTIVNHYKSKPSSPMPMMIKLQLAIAYQFGLGGLAKDESIANTVFESIKDVTAAYPDRSYYLAQAYIYIMGLSVPQDLERGFKLLEESKLKIDDVFLDIDDLFPHVKKIETEYLQKKEALQRQLIEQQEEEEKAKKLAALADQKTKGKASVKQNASTKNDTKKKDSASSSSVPPSKGGESSKGESSKMGAMRSRERKATDVTKETWNDAFAGRCSDGSHISAITPNDSSGKSTITINDPNRNEQLIVTIDENPYFFFDQVQDSLYDPRIEEGIAADIAARKPDHNFAKMLDYVIQCAGAYVPFCRVTKGQPRDQFIASVTRIDTQTKVETLCQAEYTFYKKDGNWCLYHRLLRPIYR